MSRPLIGQVLNRMGKLSAHDIDEILAQQATTRQRFGEIALQWGLCDADTLCEAWCSQLAQGATRVDLQQIGVDSHATDCVPRAIAIRLAVMPIRSIADKVIVAASRELTEHEVAELVSVAQRGVRIVIADPRQIQAALAAYYPARDFVAA